ncbi:hypothetical protein BC835DRAFT_1410417 [Cytidiella melzeri]|nr:hypothetical protein BC835DRAFT_1410417 [Cytidiella melzeri]
MADALDVASFIGPLLVEICFALILYGVFCAQVYYWWCTYKDSLLVRIIIWSLLILETVHVGFCIHVLYWYFIVNFSNVDGLEEIAWSFGITVYLEVMISATVQGFYLLRIWRLRRQTPVVCVIVLFLLGRVGLAFRTTSFAYEFSTWAGLLGASYTHTPINVGWALNVAVDAMITFVLASYLYLDRSVARKSTKNLINKLAHYAISTGALTLMASTAIFITFNARSHSLVFGGLLEILTKLYANSMLAMMNARRSVVEKAASGNNMTVELATFGASLPSYNNPGPRLAVIQVTKETTTDAWNPESERASPAVSSQSKRLSDTDEVFDSVKHAV